MQMMFLDPTGFDQQHYEFSYVRREFLGSVRTWVFDVHPKSERAWAASTAASGLKIRTATLFVSTARIPVRNRKTIRAYYFHFDSWRMNVQPGIWLPVAIYVEETNRGDSNKLWA